MWSGDITSVMGTNLLADTTPENATNSRYSRFSSKKEGYTVKHTKKRENVWKCISVFFCEPQNVLRAHYRTFLTSEPHSSSTSSFHCCCPRRKTPHWAKVMAIARWGEKCVFACRPHACVRRQPKRPKTANTANFSKNFRKIFENFFFFKRQQKVFLGRFGPFLDDFGPFFGHLAHFWAY